MVQQQLGAWLTAGMRSGNLPPQAGTLVRLYHGLNGMRHADIALEIAGAEGCVWESDGQASAAVELSLMRQSTSLGGGSTEIARNLISERVLGMPREMTADRGRSFREVKHNRPDRLAEN
jgi:alkylation response protein AidB-like acyl-CoA dehydrogenase